MPGQGIAPAPPEDCSRRSDILPQGLAPVSGVFPAGGSFAPSGDWDSSNPAFAISRGSPGTPPHTPGHELPVSWHAVVPFTFQIQVSHQIQRYLLSSLPAARSIQRCASRRSRAMERPSDRVAVRSKSVESAGGRLEAYYLMFGQYDGFAIVDLPDSRAAAATSLAVSSTGAFEHLETHELIEAEDVNPILEHAKVIISELPDA